MHKYVFDRITEGKLGHSHYAELLYVFLRNKYVTDFNNGKRTWYEFKFPQDKHEPGQVYKWAEIPNPDSLDMYLHRKLYNQCLKIEEYLNKKKSETTDKAVMKYWIKLAANVRGSARGLTMAPFKAGVLKQAETLFTQPGFVKQLNRDPMCIGVGNGVLVLSKDGKPPRLLKSYHSYKLSRYTETPYHPLDPNDPTTIKLLRAFRSMMPDDETDAFEFLMVFLSAAIDNRAREAIILLATGGGSNGKSVLTGLIQAMLGDMYACSMPFSILTNAKEDSPEGAKPMLMQLETARLAVYSEGPAAAVLFMPMVKRLTGGDPMPARQLHGTAKNIRSRCYHFVMSNHDFIVTTHEEAVWRRLRYVHLKMTFKDESQFDDENPYHRLMDRTFSTEFMENIDTKSKVLSICVFFHMKLMKYWGGVIDHVPHPTIDRSTARFRNSQDTINRFISERVVVRDDIDQPQIPEHEDNLAPAADSDDDVVQPPKKVVAAQSPVSMEEIVDKYCDWYDRNVKQIRHFRSDYHKQFLDSAIKDEVEQTDRGVFMKYGYRVLGTDDEMRTGEHTFKTKVKQSVKKDYSYVFPHETPDEYIERFRKEYKELFHGEVADNNLLDISKTYRYDTDDDQDVRGAEELDTEIKQNVLIKNRSEADVKHANPGLELESDASDYDVPDTSAKVKALLDKHNSSSDSSDSDSDTKDVKDVTQNEAMAYYNTMRQYGKMVDAMTPREHKAHLKRVKSLMKDRSISELEAQCITIEEHNLALSTTPDAIAATLQKAADAVKPKNTKPRTRKEAIGAALTELENDPEIQKVAVVSKTSKLQDFDTETKTQEQKKAIAAAKRKATREANKLAKLAATQEDNDNADNEFDVIDHSDAEPEMPKHMRKALKKIKKWDF
jgi:phage/plasmid-associated DNA primase